MPVAGYNPVSNGLIFGKFCEIPAIRGFGDSRYSLEEAHTRDLTSSTGAMFDSGLPVGPIRPIRPPLIGTVGFGLIPVNLP
jgi:hypothetical protein